MRQELIARGKPANNAFELMKRGESIRGVVTF
jgi:Zn-dependent alcohol dehydrogenase